MGLFRRRKETLNEQLLREAGIDPAGALGDSQPPVLEATPPSILRIAGVPDGSQVSPRQWDASTVVEALAVLEPLTEVRRLALKVGDGELLELGLERGDVRRLLLEPLEPAALADAEDLLEVADLHGSRVAA